MTIPRRTLLRVYLSTERMGVRETIATQMTLSIYWISHPLLDLEEISFYPTHLPSISPKYPVVKMEREREGRN